MSNLKICTCLESFDFHLSIIKSSVRSGLVEGEYTGIKIARDSLITAVMCIYSTYNRMFCNTRISWAAWTALRSKNMFVHFLYFQSKLGESYHCSCNSLVFKILICKQNEFPSPVISFPKLHLSLKEFLSPYL